ncbi:hypothetical protein KV205_04610 [Streptomyces sp. SKN60]|uniref:hypothetical protein n=1 Tax=Streptomyces sp. SKN60 TaxID=2855506 RepID=UPI0022484B93|nr:hypothetical protein [Streptomyces sp. SKN60]MCX2179814.1 hypothetical protein [Streptomyces sp. SKN60]
MPDIATTAVTHLLAAATQQGPGDTLRIVLLVSIVGGAFLAWFLLRGYRSDADTGGSADSAEQAAKPEPAAGTTAARGENGPGDANA